MDDLCYEPMDVDLSAQSTSVMDISYASSNNIDLSIVKTEPPEPDIISHENNFDVKPQIINKLAHENNFDVKPEIINKLAHENNFDVKPEIINKLAHANNFDVKPETINKLVLNKIQNRSIPVISTRNSLRLQPIILLSCVIFISILTHQISNFNCCESLNMDIMKHNLMSKLYGQTVAAESIIKALESKETKKILILYGGTGVGKTYSTALMFENVLNHNNIYHYTMPSFLQTFTSEFMLGLLFCKSTIFIVDDLTSNDILNIKSPIKELLAKSERPSRNMTIILIYNCDIVKENFSRKCDDKFPLELRQSLEEFDVKKYFIKFNSLSEEHLRNCIEDELAGRKMSARDINKIVKNFNVTLHGCKGVHQKLQYMKIL
ncbi:uncharacterized protein LOC112043691 [Bicyclus anynana]|uniref:Uncharacterized protein LOC112043691 n=1 Tax=Bicyclus anynana TaxID=110368 RepID=A0A6J1MWT5_BICAN|nr:uncharacterized protein LOC112043691 [Bicyclus anynana]